VADETFRTRTGIAPTLFPKERRSCRRFPDGWQALRFPEWTLALVIDGQLWQIIESSIVKPGKGPPCVPSVTKLKERASSGKVRRQDLQRRGEGGDRDGDRPRQHYLLPRRHRLLCSWTAKDYEQPTLLPGLFWSATTSPFPCWRPCRVWGGQGGAFHNGAPP